MKVLIAFVIVIAATMLVHSQDVILIPGELVERPKEFPALHDWSARLPDIEECTKWISSIWEQETGNPQWILDYNYSRVRYDWESSRTQVSCARVRVEFTYAFTPPAAPKLTKEQRREKKKLEEREKNTRKFLRRTDDLFSSIYRERTPRPFTLKGYPATEHFDTGCDALPCPRRTRISVKFAKERILHIDGERTLDETLAILNILDFEALNAEITKWVRTKEASDKGKGPPVAEKP